MNIPVNITENSITVFVDNRPYTVTKDAPNFNALKNAVLRSDEAAVRDSLSTKKVIQKAVSKSGSLRIENDKIFYGERQLAGAAVDKLLALIKDGLSDATPFLKFLEKLYKNPSNRSVEQLYTFLNYAHLAITPDGNVLAYKGVSDDLYSVMGNEKTPVIQAPHVRNGHILNTVGSVIEIARNSVDDNPEHFCSHGLHCGSYDYASGWGSRLLVVEFSPEDAVSVPTDCNCQKLRVCKYKVVSEITESKGDKEAPISAAVEVADEKAGKNKKNKFLDNAAILAKIVNYVNNYYNKHDECPYVDQVQSALKIKGLSRDNIREIIQNSSVVAIHHDENGKDFVLMYT